MGNKPILHCVQQSLLYTLGIMEQKNKVMHMGWLKCMTATGIDDINRHRKLYDYIYMLTK